MYDKTVTFECNHNHIVVEYNEIFFWNWALYTPYGVDESGEQDYIEEDRAIDFPSFEAAVANAEKVHPEYF